MKKIYFSIAFIMLFLHINAQTLIRTILIDFGPATQSTLSQLTTNPDANSNYWNNFTNNTAASASMALVDKSNNATGISIKTLVNFEVNHTPGAPGIGELSQLNVTALGDLAVATATLDYFFSNNASPSLKFTGLEANKAYKFSVFGCRLSSGDTRVSKYSFTGSNSAVGTLKTSEANLGGEGIHANNSSTYTTPFLFADANGEIKLDLTAQTSTFAYINAIRMEVYSDAVVSVSGITVDGNNIETINGTSQLTASIAPENATIKEVTWTVSDPKVATINAKGLLTARKNGTVTVTATSKESGSAVSGSKQIVISGQPVPVKEVYLDFGPNDGSNGDITPTNVADINGNFWNNATANAPGGISPVPTTFVNNLVDNANVATGISVAVTAGTFKTNGKQNGALLTPNINYLGELGIATATEDYFFVENQNGTLTFSNLDINKGYKFRVFGSRDNTEVRISKITLTGSNAVTGSHQTSGTNLGAAGVNRNISDIYVSEMVYPNSSGQIMLNLANQQSTFGYINAMKIEEFENAYIPVSEISVSGNDISTSGTATQMTATISPENASVKSVIWSVDNTSVATINASGMLFPLKNGTVTVTATSTQTGAKISGSKQISISNQVSELYISGTATANGDDVFSALPMKRITDAQGNASGIFEIYTTLNETGTFRFCTAQSNDADFYGAEATAVAKNGSAIDPAEEGLVLISVNMSALTYNIIPINSIEISGNAGSIPLTYKENGVWSAVVNMSNVVNDADLKFAFRINGDNNLSFKRITGTINSLSLESTAVTLGIPVEKIPVDKNSYKVSIDLSNYSYSLACPNLNNLRIAYMGSSVASGTGATNNQGYNYLYTQMLSQRYAQSKGLNFSTVNISIGGNSTLNLLSRINNDLFPLCTKYVIFGLSLGNEGIHGSSDQEATFNQFKNNMLKLINMAREKGMTPVMTNNYTRNDYTATDYGYIKRINMLIHEWDLPTINLLGAIDDGAGHWASGYWQDGLHPNDAGHAEFSYSMIPSLFDALEAGKPFPVRAKNNAVTFSNGSSVDQLNYSPDNLLHSFTHSFEFKTNASGVLSTMKTTGAISLDATTGNLVYTSPATGAKITGNTALNDNQWHRVTLTHYYARGLTLLYVDSTLVGQKSEKMAVDIFRLNDLNGPAEVSFRDWFLYRAGMNREEIAAICAGRMLKSGLELYAPLYAQGENQYENKAQSTTVISKVRVETSGYSTNRLTGTSLFPNPADKVINVNGLKSGNLYHFRIFNTIGQLTFSGKIDQSNQINISHLSAGQYLIEIFDSKSFEKTSLRFAKL
jgi:uncharacterized protein YjdB/lysophospholipase L1-like esterase